MSDARQLLIETVRRENAASTTAGATRGQQNLITSNRETALGRFLEKTGKTILMGAGITVLATAAFATAAGSLAGGMAGLLYVDGMLKPNEHHGTYVGQYGAEHGKAISGVVAGLKVTVETTLESMTPRAFIQDVSQKTPSVEEIGATKAVVNNRLEELQQKAADMKKHQEASLDFQVGYSSNSIPKN